jgi:hypothetical protein
MKERRVAAKDVAAEAFYGPANADFSSQVDRITEQDPRLRDLFFGTRARYLAGADATQSHPENIR